MNAAVMDSPPELAADGLCPLAEAALRLHPWPHRCVFSGDGIQGWLLGLTARSVPMHLLMRASLTLIVTFGEADVIWLDQMHHLAQGHTLAIPAAAAISIRAPAQADLLLLLTAL